MIGIAAAAMMTLSPVGPVTTHPPATQVVQAASAHSEFRGFWGVWHGAPLLMTLHSGPGWIDPGGFAQMAHAWARADAHGRKFPGYAFRIRSLQGPPRAALRISIRRTGHGNWGAFTHGGAHLVYAFRI